MRQQHVSLEGNQKQRRNTALVSRSLQTDFQSIQLRRPPQKGAMTIPSTLADTHTHKHITNASEFY